MEVLINKLVKVLDSEIELYENLLKKIKIKNKALVERNLEEVEKVTQFEKEFVDNLKVYETARTEILTDISKQTNIKLEELSITKISDYIPEELKQLVFKKRDKLKLLLDEVKRYNDINTQLIKQTLELFDMTMKAVSSAGKTKKPTYGRTKSAGNKKDNQQSLLIDRKV